MFLKNKNIIIKIRRSKVTEYAALFELRSWIYNNSIFIDIRYTPQKSLLEFVLIFMQVKNVEPSEGSHW